jgi:hypothetical protein
MATKPKPKPLMGRPTKCTSSFLRELSTLLAGGAHPNAAVEALGVSPDSRRRWIEKGASAPASIYGDFCRILSRDAAYARVAVGTKLHAMARQGDTSASGLWLRHVKAEGFEPQNVVGFYNADADDNDDTEAQRAALAEKLARHADAERQS